MDGRLSLSLLLSPSLSLIVVIVSSSRGAILFTHAQNMQMHLYVQYIHLCVLVCCERGEREEGGVGGGGGGSERCSSYGVVSMVPYPWQQSLES